MTITRRTIIGSLASGATLAATSRLAFAADETAEGIKRKINLAGRQRMLSQRMAMAAFLARIGIAPAEHIGLMSDAAAEFDRARIGLRLGDADLGLTREDHPSVLAAIEKVDQIWPRFGAAISEIAADGDVHSQELGALAALNMKVLSRANVVVKKLVAAYGGQTANPLEANAIDAAGRQRMLTQKMTKEAALIGLNYRRSENRSALRETIELFDNSLFGLMYGDKAASLPKPPQAVFEKLQEVEALWLDSYPILDDIASAGRADLLDLQAVALNCDPLLSLSNEAVTAYELA